MKKLNKKGFTLAELLIVVAIIAVMGIILHMAAVRRRFLQKSCLRRVDCVKDAAEASTFTTKISILMEFKGALCQMR